MISVFLQTLILLLTAHALADYPFQGDFLSRAKNKFAPVAGVPWYQALAAHAFIHAGFVFIVTGSIACCALEFLAHAAIDHNKCARRLSFGADQALHVACKILWAAAFTIERSV